MACDGHDVGEHHITGSFGVASFPVHGFSRRTSFALQTRACMFPNTLGGDRVSTAEEFGGDENGAVQRQLISGYIEGFLQREHTGPEHLEELIGVLQKFCGSEDGCNQQLLRESITALTRATELRDVSSAGHGEMVSHYCEVMARALAFSTEEIVELTYAGRVHDVGKIIVPERILNKAGPLTDDEFYVVKMHARVGSEIVATLPRSGMMVKAIECHHEAFDGSGYPAGLRGEEIPLWARILSVADAYANMTADCSFSNARSSDQALVELGKMSGVRFDGMLVRILVRELKAERAQSNP